MAVKCHPFYLPREFSVIFIICIPPDADTKAALDNLYHHINDLQSTYPEGVFIAAGDFNQANMRKVIPHFYQHVDFATRGDNILDHAYTNIKAALKAAPCPHLGSSDRISVKLCHTDLCSPEQGLPQNW